MYWRVMFNAGLWCLFCLELYELLIYHNYISLFIFLSHLGVDIDVINMFVVCAAEEFIVGNIQAWCIPYAKLLSDALVLITTKG